MFASGGHADLHDERAFTAYLAPLRRAEWVVYSKRPFGGPEVVLAYLSRYTHRVAISNSRLIAFDGYGVTFKWKDYRAKGRERQKIMTLAAREFIRRFFIHVLPLRFHRIRHYGLFANSSRLDNLARARQLLAVPEPQNDTADTPDGNEPPLTQPCPCCCGRMIVIETFERGCSPRYQPTGPMVAIRIDTS
jgi:Putative transposase